MSDNRMFTKNLYAKSDLKGMVIARAGGLGRFLARTVELIPVASGGGTVSKVFLGAVLRSDRPTPLWLAIALVRIAEDDYEMDNNVALARIADWFETKEESSDAGER